MSSSPATPRWLLLAHQLPARPSNARVKTWRRLQQIGAVPTRNSVYALPNTEPCREDVEWIRSEIVALGGEATVFAADALNPNGSDDIVASIQRARDADYQALKREADRLASGVRGPRGAASRHDSVSRTVRQLRERFNEIRRVDFFDALDRRRPTRSRRSSAGRHRPPLHRRSTCVCLQRRSPGAAG